MPILQVFIHHSSMSSDARLAASLECRVRPATADQPMPAKIRPHIDNLVGLYYPFGEQPISFRSEDF
ncbi:hypothetical protein BSQ44_04365 [Aquibium oceanicum]|uniref:Uncharacterized protein n=1 Tax=Aquibium oceanicum TaxID=1670800 RepID=A0A1L3SMZ4_9HYPH|nr:hypothetical protein BSQ44_04365 [Aquibium oceanicum]